MGNCSASTSGASSGRRVTLLLALLAAASFSRASAEQAAGDDFTAAQGHFTRARELQRLHRNTQTSEQELLAALDGFRRAAAQHPDPHLRARAQYMTGSAQHFLGKPKEALAAYQEVIEKHHADKEYLGKALVRKAAVEIDSLDPAAARQTLLQYFEAFPDGSGTADQRKEAEKMRRALELVGRTAPPIKAAKWLGSEPSGPDPLGGKVTMLYFFATWCPNCLKEVDFIKDLEQRFKPQGLQLIGVTHNTRGQTDDAVERYRQEHAFSFPVAVDSGGQTSQDFIGGSVPTAVLVDRSGSIRWHGHPAALSDGTLAQLLAGSTPLARVGR